MDNLFDIQNVQSQELQFQDLMLHRVHEILMVASPYDSFILEEDGRLTEQILHEYLGMNLSYAPRVWRAATAGIALELLSKRPYDLVIVMLRISDMDPISFGKKVKELYPNKPIILLAFDESEIKQLPEHYDDSIDSVFMWTGNSSVFPAIIKYYEDKKNIKRDIRKGNVRAIIVIEDTPRYYSNLLPMIYKEIVYHTKLLMDKSLNNTHRLLHMRARPKMLLAKNYEEAEKYFKRYRMNILGIISDIRFPENGKMNPNAGIKFAKFVRSVEKTMPIVLQSNEKGLEQEAKNLSVLLLEKNSPTLFQDLREFMVLNFGFGDFVFRNSDGVEIGRATSIMELCEILQNISEESLDYHASNNHFSNWLAARGELSLATQFREIKKSDFKTLEERRQNHIRLIQDFQKENRSAQVVDYKVKSGTRSANFLRISSGSLGGKARGLAFANLSLSETKLAKKFPDIKVRVPKIAVIGTDEFDRFMEVNQFWELALNSKNNEDLAKTFLKGRLSRELVHSLKEYLKEVNYPLAIRSSSLMEDSQYQPLAGMYSTFMLPNSHEELKERLSQVCEAIKRVFASTFFQEPKSMMDNIIQRHEEEKMAVIIMELIGQQKGQRFYPPFSGVAQSYNYYPVSYMKREEGIAFVALGFGRTIVDGGKSLRFLPKYPNILPQYYSIRSTVQNSQHEFFALDLNNGESPLTGGESKNLKSFLLNDAETDGVLKHLSSVVCSDDNVIRDSLKYDGTRVLTFASILKYKRIPLAEIINRLLELGTIALGCPVEIEFAVNLYDDKDTPDEFCLLQIKPMVIGGMQTADLLTEESPEDILCKSDLVLGDGINQQIKHIIYVDPDSFDRSKTREIAKEIESLNKNLGKDNPYMLIGPGRWGSSDPWLGIPVNWRQIANAKVIVEVGLDKLNSDPSFGSHFFQNVTSLQIGYFTISKRDHEKNVDWKWLAKFTEKEQTTHLRLLELKHPLFVRIDGSKGEGLILKPKPPKQEQMDEELSSGI